MSEILVTESYINNNYCLRPTGTAGTSTTKLAYVDWITTNYFCNVSGVGGNRCPSADEISAAIPQGLTTSVTAGFSASVTCLMNGYWTLSFTDPAQTNDYYECGYGCQQYASPPGCTPCFLDSVRVVITNYCGVFVAEEYILTNVGSGSYSGYLVNSLTNGYHLEFNIETPF